MSNHDDYTPVDGDGGIRHRIIKPASQPAHSSSSDDVDGAELLDGILQLIITMLGCVAVGFAIWAVAHDNIWPESLISLVFMVMVGHFLHMVYRVAIGSSRWPVSLFFAILWWLNLTVYSAAAAQSL